MFKKILEKLKKIQRSMIPTMRAKGEAEIIVRRPDGSMKAYRRTIDGVEVEKKDY